MSELKECPFCGNEVYPAISASLDDGNTRCRNCGAKMPTKDWNNRPIENALRARIAELEAKQRWIPVSEPPKVSGKYLLLNIYDDVYPCDFIAGTEIWVLPDYDTITHWMPLPEPPEEYQNDPA